MSERWFCVETQSNRENTARQHLEDQDFEVFLPEYIRVVTHARRRVRKKSPLYPGYLFVQFDPDARPSSSIDGTRGVLRLIRTANSLRPVPLPVGLVEDLIQQAGLTPDCVIRPKGKDPDACPYEPGETLRVKDGAFTGFAGRMERIESEGDTVRRLAVWLTIFGRPTKAVFDETQLEAMEA